MVENNVKKKIDYCRNGKYVLHEKGYCKYGRYCENSYRVFFNDLNSGSYEKYRCKGDKINISENL